ncbi:MAG: imidazole glycerol phosphate synthase subunit HisF [Firmicutes bacterium]|jgi:cyclase|nr:imidazole glycerol phosphate synthase subunit HisF [Bacillota bacterium]
MSWKRVIPCLDVQNGRVVKGVNFGDLRDVGDPAEQAAFYDREGADELVFLDITASHEGRRALPESIRQTVQAISIPLIVGGGIGSLEDMEAIFAAGASKVSINTAALVNPDLISQAAGVFGRERIIVAVDAKRTVGPDGSCHWEVYARGGRTATGWEVGDWAEKVYSLGAGEILLTSMDSDGTRDGYDNELNRLVAERVPIPIIASGGAGELEHFRDAFLSGKADAVLAASLFHFRTYSIREVKEYLQGAGIPVRL